MAMTEYHFESDAALSSRCLDVLVQNVGLLETERFIAHLSRESADYTKWRENQFEDLSLEELGQETRKSGETIRRACEVEAILKNSSAVRTK
jgi:hypothetical protein